MPCQSQGIFCRAAAHLLIPAFMLCAAQPFPSAACCMGYSYHCLPATQRSPGLCQYRPPTRTAQARQRRGSPPAAAAMRSRASTRAAARAPTAAAAAAMAGRSAREVGLRSSPSFPLLHVVCMGPAVAYCERALVCLAPENALALSMRRSIGETFVVNDLGGRRLCDEVGHLGA